MSEIDYRQLQELIKRSDSAGIPGLWLIHGQQAIVERIATTIADKYTEVNDRKLDCHALEGVNENIPDLLEQMNTYAWTGGAKMVHFKDAKIFETRQDTTGLVQQIAIAVQNEHSAKAAKNLLLLCRRLGFGVSDLDAQGAESSELKALREEIGIEALNRLVERSLSISSGASGEDYIESLLRAVEKGFPSQHLLMITAFSKAPKNLKIYKAIAKHGVIVDCSVPPGDRRSDRAAQEAALRDIWDDVLRKAQKTAGSNVFETVIKLIGYNFAIFSQSVEKVIDYCGGRSAITVADVQGVLRRSKIDPLFDLTNAVADKNCAQALFYLFSLLRSDWHPLQLLSAMANQLRKLVVAREFLSSSYGKAWTPGASFRYFQERMVTALQAYDEYIIEQSSQWQSSQAEGDAKRTASDLRLLPQPQNAFPAFQTLVKAEKYSTSRLLNALELANQADIALKRSGQNPSRILSHTIRAICRKDD
jgi:DNA polymerase-3 subunit delta